MSDYSFKGQINTPESQSRANMYTGLESPPKPELVFPSTASPVTCQCIQTSNLLQNSCLIDKAVTNPPDTVPTAPKSSLTHDKRPSNAQESECYAYFQDMSTGAIFRVKAVREYNFDQKVHPITINMQPRETPSITEEEDKFLDNLIFGDTEVFEEDVYSQYPSVEQSDSTLEHICEICKKNFSTTKKLKRHLKDVHSNKIFKCKYANCELKYKSKNALSQHYAKSHKK